MARSRVGGSRGLLSGRVGDVVYAITRDSSGGFRQSLSSYNPNPFNPSTELQICARASMACIERAMFTYYAVIQNAFQNCAAGEQSVNEFSRLNYQDIRQYFDLTYADEDNPETPYDYPFKSNTMARGGRFLISNGSLLSDGRFVYGYILGQRPQFYFYDSASRPNQTLGEWMKARFMLPGDILDVLFFVDGTSDSYNFLGRVQLSVDIGTNLNTILTSANFKRLLNIVANVPVNIAYYQQIGNFQITWTGSADTHNKAVVCYGCKVSRYEGYQWKFNRCRLSVTNEVAMGTAGWNTPKKVFDKWKL